MNGNCEIVQDLLPLYSDGVASEASTKMVEEHLPHCPACTAALEEMRKTGPKTPEPTPQTQGYTTLAKRLRRTKWYWRVCIAFMVGLIVTSSLLYAEGFRLTPLQAAYAGGVVTQNRQPAFEMEVGGGRRLYLFDVYGVYQEADVTRGSLLWRYQPMVPNQYTMDDAPLQLVVNKAIGNSNADTLDVVHVVAVRDEAVAQVEMGAPGALQQRAPAGGFAAFHQHSALEGGHIVPPEKLVGRAYAADGTLLYELAYGEYDFEWVAAA